MNEIAGWAAPAATMIAAMMTAANLGTRVTGWGFVVFTVGSIAWSIVGLSSGQTNLLLSNGFLTLVNIVGIWRWLGRQAKYEDGSKAAARRSASVRHAPSLFSAGGLIGASVTGRDGEALGSIVDAMLRCDGATLAYVVLSDGRAAGLSETLCAIDPALLNFSHDGVIADLTQAELEGLPKLKPDEWPASLPAREMPATAASAARPLAAQDRA